MVKPPAVVSRGVAVDRLATRFRQACQACAGHLAGPLVIWSQVRAELTPEERLELGHTIVRHARERLAVTADETLRRREVALILFVSDLFDL
jgi:hypothetical protein